MTKHLPLLPLLLLCGTTASAVVFNIEGDPSDASIGLNELDEPVIGWTGETNLILGDDNNQYSKADQAGIAVFQLPDLGGETIGTASLNFMLTDGAYLGGTFPKGVDLYGLRTSSSNTVLTSDYGFGPAPGNGDLIQEDFYVFTSSQPFPGDEAVSTSASADSILATWLQDQYDGGAVAGDYVFFRLNFDSGSSNAGGFGSANNSTVENRPMLTIETVPEPTTYAALLGLGVLAAACWKRRRRQSRD